MVESTMTKVGMMDDYLNGYEEKMSSSEICDVVKEVFGFNLDAVSVLTNEILGSFEVPSSVEMNSSTIPLARLVIDSYLDHYGKKMTGAEVRTLLNHFFGLNLDGVASIEKARISVFSKDQWVVQQETDLFVIHTGTGDVDVKVYPTDYFTEQTGLEELPSDLQQSLIRLGFSYDENVGSYYFSNPTGKSVPDGFKGKTIGAIVEVIHDLYADL